MASCTEPFGNEGDVLYNAEIANLTYCDGTNWNRINDSYGIPAAGLIGHWTFGDGTGTTATDGSGNGNDGTLQNMDPATDWIAGKIGTAISFSSASMNVDPFPESSSSFTELTATFWFRDGDTTGTFITSDSCISCANGRQYRIQWSAGGIRTRIADVDGGVSWSYGSTEWQHIAVVWNGNLQEVKYYRNGSEVHSNALSATSVYLGSRDLHVSNFGGLMDDLRIYNRALTADEVQALYEMGNGEPEDPVAYWKLDDGSGTTATDSVGANDGTLQNGPVWTGGRFGGALDFDGSDDYVSVDYSHTPVNVSASAWIKADTIAGDERTIVMPNGTTWWRLELNRGNSLAAHFLVGNTTLQPKSSSLSEDTWYHLVGTYDGSDAKIYVNGVLEDTETGSVTFSSQSKFIIGSWRGLTADWFDGKIDDVRIYDRALSAAEVQDLYQGACTDPVGRSGDLFYDADSDVVRWCGGRTWHATGMVPGAGGSSCSDPTGVRGDIFYNVDYMVPVYCDGTYWRPMAGKPDIPTDGLIAYWSFDTGSGTTAKDWSGNGNDGTLTNMDPSSDWVTGKVGSHALDFDGVDDIVGGTGMPNAGSDADVTLSAWIKADTLNNMWVFSQGRKGSCYNYRMSVGSGGDLRSGNTSSDVSLSGSITTGQWFHITIVYNSSGSIGYINGNFVGSSLKTTSSCNFQGWVISRQTWDTINGGNNGHFDGKIDEVRVYHRALTANEVKALYLNGL